MPVLDPGAVTHARQAGAAEPFGDDPFEAAFVGRGQHPVGVGNEVPRRAPAGPVVEREINEQLSPTFVGELAGRAAIEMEDIER
jgi:hypothetical protein